MNVEEILLKLGIDGTSFERGLRNSKEYAKEWAIDMAHTIGGAFTGLFAVEKISESTREVLEWAKSVKLAAEETGTSVEFIQGLQAASIKLGVSAEVTSNSLSILSRKIGEARTGSDEAQKMFAKWKISIDGLSNEQAFYKVLDTIRQVPDPAQRAAASFELMGKSAKEMAPFLNSETEAIQKIIESSSKLTDAEIGKLDTLKSKWESFGLWFKVFWGRYFVGQLTNWFQQDAGEFSEEQIQAKIDAMVAKNVKDDPDNPYAGDYDETVFRARAIALLKAEKEAISDADGGGGIASQSEIKLLAKAAEIREQNGLKELTTAARLDTLLRRKKDLTEEIQDMNFYDLTDGQAQVDLANTEKEILETKKKLHEEILKSRRDELQLTKELAANERSIKDEVQNIAYLKDKRDRDRLEPYMPTLDELANSGKWLFGGRMFQQGPFARTARDIQAGEGRAKQDLIFGDTEGAGNEIQKVDELKGILRGAGIMSPDMRLESIDKAMTEAKDHLAALVQQRVTILTKPANGA